jgi:hypothetical protein
MLTYVKTVDGRESECHRGGSLDSAAQTGPAESVFLRLPLELRIEVYKHLIPNALRLGSEPQYRDDFQPCYPAILRTNRQIYEEVIGLWYGTSLYRVATWGRGISFWAFTGTYLQNIPSLFWPSFRLLRSLKYDLRIDWFRFAAARAGNVNDPWTKTLADCFSRGQYALRELKLTLTFGQDCLGGLIPACAQDWSIFPSCLEWNVAPLQILRGVHMEFISQVPSYRNASFWWKVRFRPPIPAEWEISFTPELLRKMRRTTIRYLQQLASAISRES